PAQQVPRPLLVRGAGLGRGRHVSAPAATLPDMVNAGLIAVVVKIEVTDRSDLIGVRHVKSFLPAPHVRCVPKRLEVSTGRYRAGRLGACAPLPSAAWSRGCSPAGRCARM